MFRDVEIIQKEVFGEKYMDILNTKFWVARCLYKERQFLNSEKMFREEELMQKENLGATHADSLNTKYWIARCLI